MALKSYAHLRPDSSKPQGSRRQDEEDKPATWYSELTRAVGTGARDAAQAIATVPNIIPGINYDVNLPEFGPRPQTTAGKIGAGLVQIAVPYTAVLKGVSLASRLFAVNRAATAARTAAEAARVAKAASIAKYGSIRTKLATTVRMDTPK